MKILFLDDDPNRIQQTHEGNEIVYVRTPREFVDWLTANGTPDVISFDHDLAPEHYADGQAGIGYNESRSETGEDCARWAIENGYIPKSGIIVHSWNMDGAERIAHLYADHTHVLIRPFNPTARI